MTEHSTMKKRYKGNWRNVQDDCMLCEMEKKTHWYIETPDFVIAEKLGGGPFIVSKHHSEELDPYDADKVDHLLDIIFGEDAWETRVMMNLVEDHWHAHVLLDEEETELSNE